MRCHIAARCRSFLNGSQGAEMTRERDAEQAGATTRAPKRRQLNLRIDEQTYEVIRGIADAQGKTLNAAVIEMTRRLHEADQRLAEVFGSVGGFAMARALVAAAEAAAAAEGAEGGRWVQDAKSYDLAAAAVMQTLQVLRPGKLRAALARVEAPRQRLEAQEAVDGIERARAHLRERDKRAAGAR
jgi:hypothetical protein